MRHRSRSKLPLAADAMSKLGPKSGPREMPNHTVRDREVTTQIRQAVLPGNSPAMLCSASRRQSLLLPQCPVEAISACHQLGRRAIFDNPSAVEDQNPVHPLDGGQPVRNDECCASFH